MIQHDPLGQLSDEQVLNQAEEIFISGDEQKVLTSLLYRFERKIPQGRVSAYAASQVNPKP